MVASLAVWRVTHLLHAEDGPWDLAVRWRSALGDGPLGRMFGCFYCLSVWVAVPFVPWLTGQVSTGLVLWAALSAVAIVVERIVERLTGQAASPAAWYEDPHEDPPP